MLSIISRYIDISLISCYFWHFSLPFSLLQFLSKKCYQSGHQRAPWLLSSRVMSIFAITSHQYTITLYTPGHLQISWDVFAKKSADILSFHNSFITISSEDRGGAKESPGGTSSLVPRGHCQPRRHQEEPGGLQRKSANPEESRRGKLFSRNRKESF